MKKILGMLMLALSGAALAQAKPYALIEPKSVDNLGCWAPALAPMDQVFGYSALGHVFLRNTHTNEYFVLHPFKRASKGYGVFASIDAFKRDVLDEPGFQDYVLRPDHVPTVEGDSNENAGYSSFGRLYAIGYIRGLRQAVYADKGKAS